MNMKTMIMSIMLFSVVLSTAVFALTVDRSMPSSVAPSSSYTVSFTVNPEGSLTGFDLADFIPNGWTISSWDVSGYAKSDISYETQVKEYQSKTRNALHWKFNKVLSSNIVLTYTATAPAATGSYEFISLWI